MIDAALRILDRDGLESLSLRRIAREAGVSHSAPLRHFASYAELLSFVAVEGFALLMSRVEEASSSLPPGAGPRARLIATSCAYFGTAIAHPALFTLMYRPEMLDAGADAYRQAAASAMVPLSRQIRALQDGGWRVGEDTAALAVMVWSQAHGIASLWPQLASSNAWTEESVHEILRSALELLTAV